MYGLLYLPCLTSPQRQSYLLALLPYLTSLHSAPLLDCTLLRYDITWTPSEGELAVGMI